jgi:uncharacterized protein (TIGR03382 family)
VALLRQLPMDDGTEEDVIIVGCSTAGGNPTLLPLLGLWGVGRFYRRKSRTGSAV